MEFYPQRLMVAVPVRAAAAGFSDNTVLPENVRKWIAGINASSPFSDSAVNVHAVAVEEIGCTEQFDSFIGQTVISGDAMVKKSFCFRAEFDPSGNVMTGLERVDRKTLPSLKGESVRRADAETALQKLLKERAKWIEVFGPGAGNRGVFFGFAGFEVTVACLKKNNTVVLYQRNSAFADLWRDDIAPSTEELTEIYNKKLKSHFPIPKNAKLDIIWLTTFELYSGEPLTVAEIRFTNPVRNTDYILIQFNPLSGEITVYNRRWGE